MPVEKQSKKEKILMIALTFVLVLVVAGTTYAVFNFVGGSTTDNLVNTGTISMSYTEPSNALVLENALPMSDEEGENQTDYFEFEVTTNVTGNIKVPYEINITPLPIDEDKQQLPDNAIKFFLVTAYNYEIPVINPTTFDNLSNSTLRENSKILITQTHDHINESTLISYYMLRVWIDASFDVSDETIYQYRFRVNVDSKVLPTNVEELVEAPIQCFEFDERIGTIDRYYANYDDISTNQACPDNIIIPSSINGVSVTKIGNHAFNYEGTIVHNVVVPEGVIEIGNVAFQYSGLESISLPSTLEIIGSSAFAYCNFKNISIPESVTTIGDSAFYQNQLTSVIIKGKSSTADFTSYPTSTPFGWASGYSDSNIIWQP